MHLDAEEYKSTWLGNKSIYRTRMAIADGGKLVVLAPGVTHFGEDKQIDVLIRKYGYRTTPVRAYVYYFGLHLRVSLLVVNTPTAYQYCIVY